MADKNKQLPYYRLSADEVLDNLHTKRAGLTNEQAGERLAHYGKNELAKVRKVPPLLKYARQFKDLMIILLLASSMIAFFLLDDVRTGAVLFALVLLNTTFGFLQEYKAERIMESLEKLVFPEAKVLRNDKLEEAQSIELIPGDIVYIEEGDSVPADIRIIEESELATNDFALTGESNPSRKFVHAIAGHVELASRHNLAFMGTTVATGHAYGVVIATGSKAELGRIASMSEDTSADLSPLQKELNHTAARVTQGTVILCLLLLPIAIKSGLGSKAAFLFAIGIASSLIPNGLPAAINAALAQAANKLAKSRALVKKLSAVETLGATSIICTDKTGTLTKNEMTVEQLFIGGNSYDITGTGYEPNGHIVLRGGHKLGENELDKLGLFFSAGAFASNARISGPDDEHAVWYTVGDPTEGALITLAEKAGINTVELNNRHPELKEFAFDSARKRMSSLRTYGDKKQQYIFVKGAPEQIIDNCDEIWDGKHVRKLTLEDRRRIADCNDKQARSAMRNLAFAYRVLPAHVDGKKLTIEKAEEKLVYLGMVSMIDPLREEVPEAMRLAHRAHIKISIVTGDFAPTAKAIAVKAGLAEDPKDIVVVSGEELRALDDSRILQLVERGGVVFSRVSPEDKLRIVSLVEDAGQVVAVTGDGINDAPALKRANIGVAMGRTGTDVAKQSAEIILLDDSFYTLIGAVEQGRVIFQNIKKGTLNAFTANAAELTVNLFSLGFAVAFHVPLALSVMQILAIDVIAELFPIAALGWDQADGELMVEEPRDPKSHILNRGSITDIFWCGFLIGGLAFANYLLFYHRVHINPQGLAAGSLVQMKATSLTYLTIVICGFASILDRRSLGGIFSRYQLHNKQLWFAFGLSIFCILNIIYNPWIAPYFHSASLTLIDWLYAVGAAAIFIMIREFQRRTQHHTRAAVHALHPDLQNSVS